MNKVIITLLCVCDFLSFFFSLRRNKHRLIAAQNTSGILWNQNSEKVLAFWNH